MTINGLTINSILCGSIALDSSTIRALLTRESNIPIKNYVSDFPADSIDHISEPYNTVLSADAGSYLATKGVYLSCNSCIFTNITADYTDSVAYLYNYIDTGDSTTDNIISYQVLSSPVAIGETTFTITDNKILNLTDGLYSHRSLYRQFRENLLTGSTGDLNNLTIGCALVSSSYVPNIEDTGYSSISSIIVSEGLVPNTYISDGGLKTTDSYISLPVGTGVASSVVFYISSVTPESIELIGYYNSSSSLTPDSLSANNNELYVKLDQKTIFNLL